MFQGGISKEGDLMDLGVAMGMIKKTGAFFSFGDTRLGQGRENAKSYLRQHPEVAAEIESQIRSKGTLPAAAIPVEEEAATSE
jgi:recombination protein RecA